MRPVRYWAHGTDTEAIADLNDMRIALSTTGLRDVTLHATRRIVARRHTLTDWSNFIQNVGLARLITAEKVVRHFASQLSFNLARALRRAPSHLCVVLQDTANGHYIIITFMECSNSREAPEPLLTVPAHVYGEQFWERVTLYTPLPGVMYGMLMDTAEYTVAADCRASETRRTARALIDRMLRRYMERLVGLATPPVPNRR